MRELEVGSITQAVALALKTMHYQIRPDVRRALEQAYANEASPLGREALQLLLENAKLAGAGVNPLCQDTGLTVIWAQVGQDLHVVGGSLEAALQAGVRLATQEGRLRHSVVAHPLKRDNTGDNTPAVVHYQIVPGAVLKLAVMAKGGGCDNVSSLSMLTPSAGLEGVQDHILQMVRERGAMACPPLILGVGLGGNFESVAGLAKQALLRPVGEPSPDPELAALERTLLDQVNALGIGPQGWGGSVTALAVAVEAAPCHIASLPVAVSVECHSHRVAEVIL